ncbi:hypothetical protein HGM15179_012455 [Zosterops borbonicus]|uniref:Uncharacterized protein n=1 Tax=Zosterops borbonicus TaxID=364589 RepID=A0A8K1LIA7_9PASS|nr:hypothetical protein HGM15179_012455 [Zosterops borbonicus]
MSGDTWGSFLSGWEWFGSSSLGGASHTGVMKCVMSLVSLDGPLTEDIPVEEIRNTGMMKCVVSLVSFNGPLTGDKGHWDDGMCDVIGSFNGPLTGDIPMESGKR